MERAKVAVAKRLMLLQERRPPSPHDVIGGSSEVFRHPLFTEGSEAERERVMHDSAQSRYEDENAFPWDNYFGRHVAAWVGGDVLDLGCFTGGRAVAWWDRYRPRSISGMDVNQDFIQAAQRFAQRRHVPAEFRVGFGERIPWPEKSFDAILTFDVLEHVRNLRETLLECRRILRPGGRLLLVFPSYFQPIEHHLTMVTGMPGLQYLFSGRTLVEAYCQILRDRGPEAHWYGRAGALEPWERGNTINGTTSRRFAQIVREGDWDIVLHARLPIGAVGRRAQAGRGRALAVLARPLTRIPGVQEAALHRITYILHKPSG